jgi:hypothetical protein
VSVSHGIVTSYPSDESCACPWPRNNPNCDHYCPSGNAYAYATTNPVYSSLQKLVLVCQLALSWL